MKFRSGTGSQIHSDACFEKRKIVEMSQQVWIQNCCLVFSRSINITSFYLHLIGFFWWNILQRMLLVCMVYGSMQVVPDFDQALNSKFWQNTNTKHWNLSCELKDLRAFLTFGILFTSSFCYSLQPVLTKCSIWHQQYCHWIDAARKCKRDYGLA